MKRLPVILLLFFFFSGLGAQESLMNDSLLLARKRAISSFSQPVEKTIASEWAAKNRLKERERYSSGRIIELRRLNKNLHPQFLSSTNLEAAQSIKTDLLWPADSGDTSGITGFGLVAGVWDGGVARESHREFEARARIMNEGAEVDGHASHVSGTIAASGVVPEARGMAWESMIECYDWDRDLQEMEAAAEEGLLISNHSYGYIIGFDYDSDESRWQWYGDLDISLEEDYLFGFYHSEAREYDRIMHANPNYLIVKSAGNDRGEGPSEGTAHWVWDNGGWEESSISREVDGGSDGWDCIGAVATAKNILAVAAMTDQRGMSDYSAFGPTDDGRIKPDITSNGDRLYSTGADNDQDYNRLSGTSMAAPTVSGSLLLLQELYFRLNSSYMRSSTLKGLALHTADDAGNPGPDYSFGWGILNSSRAATLIREKIDEINWERSLSQGGELSIRLYSTGVDPVKATLCWTDPAGIVPEESLDPVNPVLVNDLDVTIIREADGEVFRPWVLNPFMPGNDAVKGDNTRDNVEQVLIGEPEAGFYTILVRHKGSLQAGKQDLALITSGLTYEFYADGYLELTENNGSILLTSADEYLENMRASWLIRPENNQGIKLGIDFLETEAGKDTLCIYDSPAADSLIARFSGNLTGSDTLIVSENDTLYLRFSSDQENQDRGFRLFYCSAAPEGDFLIRGEEHPCIDSQESFSVTGQPGTYYSWTPPSGWTIEEVEASLLLDIGSGPGTLLALPFNYCGSSTEASFNISPLSSAPVLSFYSGDTTACEGTMNEIRVDSLPGATYIWNPPVSWVGSGSSHELSYIPSRESGVIRVQAVNSCAAGNLLDISVSVNTAPGRITLAPVNSTLCANSLQEFTIYPEEQAGGVSYLWSVNEGDWSIEGESDRDTLAVRTGNQRGKLGVERSNECGNSYSVGTFTLTPEPDFPLISSKSSDYEDYRELEVQNSTAYKSIFWYLDGTKITSARARGPRYVAYVPGTYSVEVVSNQGCTFVQDPGDGLRVAGAAHNYSAYAGMFGYFVVYNSTSSEAIATVYGFDGKVQMIKTVQPGYNEFHTHLLGAYIVEVDGPGEAERYRVFLR